MLRLVSSPAPLACLSRSCVIRTKTSHFFKVRSYFIVTRDIGTLSTLMPEYLILLFFLRYYSNLLYTMELKLSGSPIIIIIGVDLVDFR